MDPTIFVREYFIFAGNSLVRRGALSFPCAIPSPVARNSFAHRRQFSRTSRGRVHPASPRRRLVQVVEFRSRRCDRSPRLASLQQNEAVMDLLASRRCKKRRRRWISFVPARRKEAARGGKKRVTRGEESYRGKLQRRGEYGHDKESKILRISKLPSHCAYAKMPSLVHQMPSLPKCINQMQNCWRAIFKVFGKFQECKVPLHNCWRCSIEKKYSKHSLQSTKVKALLKTYRGVKKNKTMHTHRLSAYVLCTKN